MAVVKEVRQGDETGRHGDMETRRDETRRDETRRDKTNGISGVDGLGVGGLGWNGDGGRRGRRAEATGGEENVEWRE